MAETIVAQISEKPYFWRENWHHPLRPEILDEKAVMFLVLCDAFNFCFWPGKGQKDFGNRGYSRTFKFLSGSGTSKLKTVNSLRSKLKKNHLCDGIRSEARKL